MIYALALAAWCSVFSYLIGRSGGRDAGMRKASAEFLRMLRDTALKAEFDSDQERAEFFREIDSRIREVER